MLGWRQRLRRGFYELRVEGEGLGREAAALGIGVFIGCTPFYGFHLLLCWVTGWALRLNRLKLYLASNISNPLFSPFLLFAELQTGAWIRRQDLHDLTIAAIKSTSPWTFGMDLLVGSFVVGAVLGLTIAGATLATGGLRETDRALAELWHRASEPYLQTGVTAWEFARGKLRGDPVYRAILAPGVLVGGSALVDLGCGGGLALSAIREASRASDPARRPPRFDRLIGVELRAGAAAVARRALGDDATIVVADVRHFDLPVCSTVLMLDVLHMLPRADQDQLVARAAARLEPGGALVVREADAAGGAGFFFVRAGNRLKAILTGNWRQRFAFRTRDEWTALLGAHGMRVEISGAGAGTPFANLLVVGRRQAGRASRPSPSVIPARDSHPAAHPSTGRSDTSTPVSRGHARRSRPRSAARPAESIHPSTCRPESSSAGPSWPGSVPDRSAQSRTRRAARP
jgi:uncharacterized protein (DUF2062 family)